MANKQDLIAKVAEATELTKKTPYERELVIISF